MHSGSGQDTLNRNANLNRTRFTKFSLNNPDNRVDRTLFVLGPDDSAVDADTKIT